MGSVCSDVMSRVLMSDNLYVCLTLWRWSSALFLSPVASSASACHSRLPQLDCFSYSPSPQLSDRVVGSDGGKASAHGLVEARGGVSVRPGQVIGGVLRLHLSAGSQHKELHAPTARHPVTI